jgi:uncharacterized OB-fold protein
MVKCERCGEVFTPICAAVVAFCPHCRARDKVTVPLIVSFVKDPSRGSDHAWPAPADDQPG